MRRYFCALSFGAATYATLAALCNHMPEVIWWAIIAELTVFAGVYLLPGWK